jgi:hypothetical protein
MWNCQGPPSGKVPRPMPSTTKGGADEEVLVCAGIAAAQEIKSAIEQSALNTRRRGSMLQEYDYAPAFNQMANEANSARPIHRSSSAQIPDSGRVTCYAFSGGGSFCNASGPLAVPTESVGWADTTPPTRADNRSLVRSLDERRPPQSIVLLSNPRSLP